MLQRIKNKLFVFGKNNHVVNIVTTEHVQMPLTSGVPWHGEVSNFSMATRLDWRSRWNPFTGRDLEMDHLNSWAHSQKTFGIEIIEADGGYGKTRLAAEFASALQNAQSDAWQVIWLNHLQDFSRSQSLYWQKGQVMLVVDYPEQAREQLNLLLRCALRTAQSMGEKNSKRLRVLLLCRRNDGVRTALQHSDCSAYASLEPLRLQSLPPDMALRLMQASLLQHAPDKTKWLTRPADEQAFAQWLNESPLHPTPLFISALALFWSTQTQPTWTTGSDLLQAVIDHETKHWVRAAQGHGLDVVFGAHAMLQVHAFATLLGGLNVTQLTELAQAWKWTDVQTQNLRQALAQVCAHGTTTYPPMQPDLLAAQLLTHWQSQRHPKTAQAHHTYADTQGIDTQALLTLLDQASPAQVLGWLQRWNMHGYDQTMRLQATDNLEQFLLNVLVQNTFSPANKRVWLNACNSQITWYGVPRLVLTLGRPQIPITPDDDLSTLAHRASELSNHAVVLARAGQRESALTAAQEAATIRRRLAQAQPQAFEPDLAGSLNNLANHLSDLGQREGALSAAQECVTIRRRLAQAQPQAFEADLAMSLSNLANRLSDLGQHESALSAAKEATALYRRLAQTQPQTIEPDLAMSLNNLGSCLSTLGLRECALTAVQEATAIYRRLANAQPEAFEPDLAGSLNNLASCLSVLGRRGSALSTAQEAVNIHRRLAHAQPKAFEPVLAASLNNLANFLSDLGQRESALTAEQGAVIIRRRLAQAQPQAFEPDLAKSLNNLASFFSYLGQRDAALSAAQEATALYRRLAQAQPQAFAPDLARCLNNYSSFLRDLGQHESALSAAEEATAIYRQLVQDLPQAFEPDLAMTLNNYAQRLSDMGLRESALIAAQESVNIRRRLAKEKPEAFGPDLAGSLNNLSNRLIDMGQLESALTSAQEATALYRRYAQEKPEAFEPDLAGSLNNLANRLSDLGQRESALTSAQEATALYRRYAQEQPQAFELVLAASLNNLANRLSELDQRMSALTYAQEAVILYEKWETHYPEAIAENLTKAKNTLQHIQNNPSSE